MSAILATTAESLHIQSKIGFWIGAVMSKHRRPRFMTKYDAQRKLKEVREEWELMGDIKVDIGSSASDLGGAEFASAVQNKS